MIKEVKPEPRWAKSIREFFLGMFAVSYLMFRPIIAITTLILLFLNTDVNSFLLFFFTLLAAGYTFYPIYKFTIED